MVKHCNAAEPRTDRNHIRRARFMFGGWAMDERTL
jgi:hypothetical protein